MEPAAIAQERWTWAKLRPMLARMDQTELDRFKALLDAEMEALAEKALEQAMLYRQRFRFSLAIGNGAGLVYVGAMMSSGTAALPWWHVLPSAWSFLIGAGCAGTMIFVRSLASTAKSSRWKAVTLVEASQRIRAAMRERDGAAVENESGRENEERNMAQKFEKESARYGIAAWVFEIGAAIAFVVGAAYPLIILSSRSQLAPL